MIIRSYNIVLSLWLIVGVSMTASCTRAKHPAEEAASPVKLPSNLERSVKPSEKLARVGKIVMCTELGNPPGSFLAEDGETPKGFNVDIMYAIGPVMGVKSEITHYRFASIFAALDSGKCDAVMSSTSKSPTRAAKYNFIAYLTMRMGMMVPKGNPLRLKTYEDLSGHRAAVLVSSTNERLLKAVSEKLVAEGRKPIGIESYPQTTTLVRQLDLRRVDAFVGDAMTIGYFTRLLEGRFEVGGLPVDPVTVGIVMRKDDPLTQDAVSRAYAALYDSGYVEKSAKAWGMDGLVVLCRDNKQCP